MRAEQSVNEMAQVVLWRQARALAQRTGEPLLEALEAVLETPAGRQLEELRVVRTKMRRRATGRLICCLSA